MTSYICCICEVEISEEVIAKRHYWHKHPMPPLAELTCSKSCQNRLRARNNFYKQMSQKVRQARSTAVAKSNKEHPRRRNVAR